MNCHTPSSRSEQPFLPFGNPPGQLLVGQREDEALVNQEPSATQAAHNRVRQPAQGVREGPGHGPAPGSHPDQHGGPVLRRGPEEPIELSRGHPDSHIGGLEPVNDPAGERSRGHDDDLPLIRRPRASRDAGRELHPGHGGPCLQIGPAVPAPPRGHDIRAVGEVDHTAQRPGQLDIRRPLLVHDGPDRAVGGPVRRRYGGDGTPR